MVLTKRKLKQYAMLEKTNELVIILDKFKEHDKVIHNRT